MPRDRITIRMTVEQRDDVCTALTDCSERTRDEARIIRAQVGDHTTADGLLTFCERIDTLCDELRKAGPRRA